MKAVNQILIRKKQEWGIFKVSTVTVVLEVETSAVAVHLTTTAQKALRRPRADFRK